MTSMEAARLSYDLVEPEGHKESQLSPIIMLHGLTDTRRTWKELSQDLANKTGRKVYVLDARNHGDSEWKNEHTYRCMAHDVSQFMNQQGISSAALVGHSMGGKTAMYLATKEPKKVEKLIIEDVSNKTLDPSLLKHFSRYLKLLRSSLDILTPDLDLDKAKRIVYELLLLKAPPELRKSEEKGDFSSLLPLQKTADGEFSWKLNFDALLKDNFWQPTSDNEIDGLYEGPTLVIYGTTSFLNVENDKEHIEKIFPNTTFKAIEGATHRVHNEYPNEFLEAVLSFLK